MIITREKLAQLIDEEFDKAMQARKGKKLVESKEEHVGDPRWEDHAEPTGRNWDSGLDEADDELDEAKPHKKGGGRASLGFGIPEEDLGYGSSVVDEIIDEVSLAFYKQVMQHFSKEHLKPGTIEGMLKRLEPVVR